MLIMKLFGYAGLAIVAGVTIQQMMTTQNLLKVDMGLNSSLHSTSALATIEQSIIAKNEKLHDVVNTTKSMDQQLDMTLSATNVIDQNIRLIDTRNGSTLKVNQGMAGLSSQSTATLGDAAKQMEALDSAVSKVQSNLQSLENLVKTDAVHLHDMLDQTDTMNQKVPGVTG